MKLFNKLALILVVSASLIATFTILGVSSVDAQSTHRVCINDPVVAVRAATDPTVGVGSVFADKVDGVVPAGATVEGILVLVDVGQAGCAVPDCPSNYNAWTYFGFRACEVWAANNALWTASGASNVDVGVAAVVAPEVGLDYSWFYQLALR